MDVKLRRRFSLSILGLLASVALLPVPAAAQTGLGASSLLPPPGESMLSISLFGGWASFSQQPVNDMIRLDNLLLTAPTEEGGAGLDKGLDQLTDGITFGAEVRYRLSPHWSALVGFERLSDRTRLDFTFDPGTGPEECYIEYKVDAWPIYAGMAYSFRFTERLTYRMGVAAVYFPSSRLHLAGRLGGLADIEQEGTASGIGDALSWNGEMAIGAALSWSGEMAINGPLSLLVSIRLRLGRVGDPKDDDSGDTMTNPYTGDVLTIDWSGVDILIGVTVDLF